MYIVWYDSTQCLNARHLQRLWKDLHSQGDSSHYKHEGSNAAMGPFQISWCTFSWTSNSETDHMAISCGWNNFFCLVHNKILLLIVQTLPWSPSPNDLFGMGVRNAEAEYVMLIMNVDWNCWFPATRAAKAGSHSKLWFNYSSYPQRRYWSISVDETHIWFVNHLFWWNPHRPRVHLLPNSNTRISSSVRVVKSPFHAVSILVPLDCHTNARLSQYSGCAAVGWSQLKLIKQRAPWM